MQFLNLEKLKVEKTYSYQTIEEDILIEQNPNNIFVLKEASKKVCSNMINATALPTNYEVTITVMKENEVEDKDAFFLSLVNVFNAIFFADQCADLKPRKGREYRLGIPPAFQILSVNNSLLKRIVNFNTKNNIFNVTLIWHSQDEEYVYSLVPQEEIKESSKNDN